MITLLELGSFKLLLAWYDMWIGVFVDTKQKVVYICPLPMVVIRVELWQRERTIL